MQPGQTMIIFEYIKAKQFNEKKNKKNISSFHSVYIHVHVYLMLFS